MSCPVVGAVVSAGAASLTGVVVSLGGRVWVFWSFAMRVCDAMRGMVVIDSRALVAAMAVEAFSPGIEASAVPISVFISHIVSLVISLFIFIVVFIVIVFIAIVIVDDWGAGNHEVVDLEDVQMYLAGGGVDRGDGQFGNAHV